MTDEITVNGIEDIGRAAETFAAGISRGGVYAFYGAMGAGKTTFIKAVCKVLGVDDAVTSPTFAIVNEYRSERLSQPIYHFDFYRVRRIEEAYDMGCDEYFYSGALCFIEWPEVVESILPDDTVNVRITETGDGKRHITAGYARAEKAGP